MSEWVSDCRITPIQQFSAISWGEQVNFQWDDDEVRFVLDQHAELDFYNASSLKQKSAGRHVAPLGHIIPIPSQPVYVLFLLNAACLAEKQQIPILVFALTRPGFETTIYRTRGEHANHYATDAVLFKMPVAIQEYNSYLPVILFVVYVEHFSTIIDKTPCSSVSTIGV